MTSVTVSDASWSRLGDVAPGALTDARLQLHHAVQIAVSAAISYLQAKDDDSHTALVWSPTLRALTTEPIAGGRPFRIGVRVEDLTLLAVDGDSNRTSSTFDLSGRTIADGHAWLAAIAVEAGSNAQRLTSRKHYDIPDHAVGRGAPFALGGGTAFHELTRYWANASGVLEAFARANPARQRFERGRTTSTSRP